MPSDNNRQRRDSGEPGGGAGRKEEVGGSGVYPMSGPHPGGPAQVQPAASWGQGDRGAAGYGDAGHSELRTETPAGSAHASHETAPREIAHPEWRAALQRFTTAHAGAPVSLELHHRDGTLIEVRQAPLVGVSLDDSAGAARIYIHVGDLVHPVAHPRQVRMRASEATGEGVGLEISADDQTRTVIRFRAAGAAPHARQAA